VLMSRTGLIVPGVQGRSSSSSSPVPEEDLALPCEVPRRRHRRPRVDDPPDSAPIRIQFVASQLVGVVMARCILESESPLTRQHESN
jgi:hypothetical protein